MANEDAQLVTPLDKIKALGKFEGKDVLGSGVKCNLGGGLKEALTIDPVKLKIGERMYLVIEAEVTDVQHPKVKDTEGVRRNHVLKVVSAAVTDREAVEKLLDEQAQRIEEAKGIQRLQFTDDLQDAHDRGEHKDGLVENCPDCEREAELAASEARDAASS